MPDDWGDLENISKPKSQVPKLLFCGCGCLIPVLLVILVLLYGMSTVNRGKDTALLPCHRLRPPTVIVSPYFSKHLKPIGGGVADD